MSNSSVLKALLYHPLAIHSFALLVALHVCSTQWKSTTIDQTLEIPCCFYNAQHDNCTAVEKLDVPSSVQLTLRGTQSCIRQWSQSQPAVHFDAAKIIASHKNLSLVRVVDHIFLPDNLQIISLKPSHICIKVKSTPLEQL